MKKLIVLALCFIGMSFSAHKSAYQLYNAQGKSMRYEQLLKQAAEADIVLFGELHNNPIAHWLQYELTKDLYAQVGNELVLGAEMFESDDQLVVNEYLQGRLSDKSFKDECKLWPNYTTDYKPLMDFAKKNGLPFIATNIPRRYASMVFNRSVKVLDSLSDEAKRWICPLPYAYDTELPCYKNIGQAAGMHGGDNLPRSQAIKDATMAHFILKNYHRGNVFLHYNGSYHSNNHESIVWYLKQKYPNLKILTIATQEQSDASVFDEEDQNLADFILYVPETMTKTH